MSSKESNKKKFNPIYLLSIITLIIGYLLMEYLIQVYFVGIIILFILIAFQTPSRKVDKTGEANDFSIKILRIIGLNTILYLIGGYLSALT
jgi:hypothetical protein